MSSLILDKRRESRVCYNDGYQFFHRVKMGESLHSIVRTYYPSSEAYRYDKIYKQISDNNPEIKNKDLLFQDQLVFLRVPFREELLTDLVRADLRLSHSTWSQLSAHEREIAYQYEKLSLLLSAGHDVGDAFEHALDKGGVLLENIAKKFLDYKEGRMPKAVYDNFRTQKLREYQKAISSDFQWLFHRSKTPREFYRLNPATGRQLATVADAESKMSIIMSKNMGRIAKVAKIASRTAVVLQIADLGVEMYEMYNAHDNQERLEILAKEVASLSAGMSSLYILEIGVVAIAGSVGVIPAIVIGTAAAFTGCYIGDKAKNIVHGLKGENHSIVDILHLQPLLGL